MLLPQATQAVLYNVPTAAISLPDLPFEPTPLTTGIACYAVGFLALSAWEHWAVPYFKLHSILPDVPLLPGQLTEQERLVAFITPYTSRLSTPPPTLDELRKRGDYMVGAVEDVCQFITCESHPHIRGVSAPSPEWSSYYGTDVTIFKKRRA